MADILYTVEVEGEDSGFPVVIYYPQSETARAFMANTYIANPKNEGGGYPFGEASPDFAYFRRHGFTLAARDAA